MYPIQNKEKLYGKKLSAKVYFSVPNEYSLLRNSVYHPSVQIVNNIVFLTSICFDRLHTNRNTPCFNTIVRYAVIDTGYRSGLFSKDNMVRLRQHSVSYCIDNYIVLSERYIRETVSAVGIGNGLAIKLLLASLK